MALEDLGLVDGDFLAGGFGEDEEGAFLAAEEAGDGAAVFEGGDAVAEDLIDVAVGIEDIFAEALEAAVADAVEFWADTAALAVEVVANRAMELEGEGAGGGVAGGGGVFGLAGGDDMLEALGVGAEGSGEAGKGFRKGGAEGEELIAQAGLGEEAGGGAAEGDGFDEGVGAWGGAGEGGGDVEGEAIRGLAEALGEDGAAFWRSEGGQRGGDVAAGIEGELAIVEEGGGQGEVGRGVEAKEGAEGGGAGAGVGGGVAQEGGEGVF